MNEAQRLAKAKADYEAALADVRRLKIEAEAAEKVADIALGVAERELEDAQMAADRLLPTCVMHSSGWRATKLERNHGCVVKRTAKSAFVKIVGQPDDRARQFRLNKSGRWDQYPRADTWVRLHYWIEFPEESPSAPDPV